MKKTLYYGTSYHGKKAPSFESSYNDDKDKFNHEVCKAMKMQQCKTVLLMDGRSMRSSQACKNIGIKAKNITTVEKNRAIHNLHLRKGVNSIHSDIWLTLREENPYKPYDSLVLDTCSAASTVSSFLEFLFLHRFVGDQSVIALTMTKRSPRKGEVFMDQLCILRRVFKATARKYGFTIRVFYTQKQSKVVSLVYTVTKNEDKGEYK